MTVITDDKNIPSSIGKVNEDALNQEEERLMRNINKHLPAGTDINAHHHIPTPKVHIHLRDLPTSENKPVTISINGNKVYESAQGGDISGVIEEELPKQTNAFKIGLSIPEVGVEQTKEFDYSAGAYIIFAGSDSGLSIKQQNTPF